MIIANVLSAQKVDTEGIAKLGVDYIYVLKVILQEENKPITILRQKFEPWLALTCKGVSSSL